mmetsp:Transcript_61562/g.133251  ORF Transcript_61562/g.133251 Transcript_61562/m.133251 type:complete len:502 (-) Transcript_61562:170-1675(-)|eukprot:CAMPEP_0170598692 /NCGR_PEP_ID=MMETSP0224-20130122/16385_1 /TAXON_ID=285029 /ORGANISM="Togula jolla, Strain CCCM 725" /LENGTH=501 /DNA_ID=CAMNT_0010923265 /DNA_START=3 /DNA_END=1508 /DNA_ORIENTATION=+
MALKAEPSPEGEMASWMPSSISSQGAAHDLTMHEVRRNNALSMEGFIKHQMVGILQPFLDQVQTLDDKMSDLGRKLQQTDGNVDSTRRALDVTSASVKGFEDSIKKMTDQMSSYGEEMAKLRQNHEELQKGMELTNEYVQRIHNQSEGTADTVQELQRGAGDTLSELQSVRAQLQRTSDSVENDVQRILQRMSMDLQDLKGGHSKTCADVQHCRSELDRKARLLQDTCQVLEKTGTSVLNLQQSFEAMSVREGQLSAKLEGWKQQWSKLHPGIEAIRKDVNVVKQRSEHQEAVVHGLQQGCANTFSIVEALQRSHEGTAGEVMSVRHNITTTQKALDDTCEKLGRSIVFAECLQKNLARTDSDVHQTNLRVDNLESKQGTLSESMEKMDSDVGDLQRLVRGAAGNVETLQRELTKTNESLGATGRQLEATGAGVQTLNKELGRTNESLKRLDHSVELCHAGFTGLQKGFVETNSHIASRATILPKIGRQAVDHGLDGPEAA